MYLNGNNELAEEMEDTFLDIKNNIKANIKIAIQISKAQEEVGKIIRQKEVCYKENWNGVRRYSLINGNLKLEQCLEDINMVDYRNLYDFIVWGMNNFNSERYALVISGHGFMLSVMTDFTRNMPYTMGLYEMSFSINNVSKDINKFIDILIMDVCSVNSLEFLYELGKNKKNTVKNLLTYVANGPLEGLKYSDIIEYFNNDSNEEILSNIVRKLSANLVAFEINHNKLVKLKNICSEMVYEIINSNDSTILEKYNELINKSANKLVIAKDKNISSSVLDIICLKRNYLFDNVNMRFFIKMYSKFSFVKNSYCSNFIRCSGASTIEKIVNPKATDTILIKDDIIAIIKAYNNELDYYRLEEIAEQLYKYQDWLDIEKILDSEDELK